MHRVLDEIERALVEQLTSMGWRYLASGLGQVNMVRIFVKQGF